MVRSTLALAALVSLVVRALVVASAAVVVAASAVVAAAVAVTVALGRLRWGRRLVAADSLLVPLAVSGRADKEGEGEESARQELVTREDGERDGEERLTRWAGCRGGRGEAPSGRSIFREERSDEGGGQREAREDEMSVGQTAGLVTDFFLSRQFHDVGHDTPGGVTPICTPPYGTQIDRRNQ